MRAMVIDRIGPLSPDSTPLRLVDRPPPVPGPHEVRLRVSACGVCHTELDEIEGRTPPPRLPIVPGHEVVGRIDALGDAATRHALGTRVGVGWIFRSSGDRHENTDPAFRATGRDADGGYAEYMVVHEDYAYAIPDAFGDVAAAPLLCAGAVGYRALRLTGIGAGQALGLTGFGGSAHLVLQLVRHAFPDVAVFVFARSAQEREFARALGAAWAGDTDATPPRPLDAVIDTTPAWRPVLAALAVLKPGGRLVINAIRKEAADRDCMAQIDYERHLWMEKELKSVANVTQHDLREFLPLAAEVPLEPSVTTYPLEAANQALLDLKFGHVRGAKVLVIDGDRNRNG